MKNVAVIFGGQSEEHFVSIISGTYISTNIDKEKYKVSNIYIDKKGNWYEYKDIDSNISFGKEPKNIKKINNIMEYLKQFDVLFPILHGTNGEDGTIQGLFEMLKIPYVGSRVLASSVAMDKIYTKIVLDKANIKQVKHQYIRSYNDKYIYINENFNEKICEINEIVTLIENNINYPMFVKPSNSGSSIGISKVNNKEELIEGINEASKYDKKILIEEGLEIRELECAVLGNEDVIASPVGEIIAAQEFYDYDAKYNNENSKTIRHADIKEELENEIRNTAIKAFKAIDGKGLSRVDFFLDKDENIYLNEINTLPGFTSISMYPKLFEECGIGITELTTRLIELSLEQ